ncbi:MAG: hypothetical protein M1536_01985 [Firmicutes bacterium]|nr:hypothetical protein [Bacillota bacterium]
MKAKSSNPKLKIWLWAVILIFLLAIFLIHKQLETRQQPVYVAPSPSYTYSPSLPYNEPMPEKPLKKIPLPKMSAKERMYLSENGYIKAYQKRGIEDSADMVERIINILEILRAPKKVVEGKLIREAHGMNGGAIDIKTDSGRKLEFYWSGSWGHPTLLMDGGINPSDLKLGNKIRVVFKKTKGDNGYTLTAVGILRNKGG